VNTTARRPTEGAAMRGAGKQRHLPPMHVLLTGRCVARMVGDLHGLQLFDCAIRRSVAPEVGER
jgi:hypothetical protein